MRELAKVVTACALCVLILVGGTGQMAVGRDLVRMDAAPSLPLAKPKMTVPRPGVAAIVNGVPLPQSDLESLVIIATQDEL